MKSITVLALSLLLSACSLTPRQKAFIASSVALSVALSLKGDSGKAGPEVALPSNPCANPEACR